MEFIGAGSNAFTVERREIPPLFTDSFWKAVQIWQRWRKLGMPFSGGWAEQPTHIVEIIDMLESMCKEWENKPKVAPKKSNRRITQ